MSFHELSDLLEYEPLILDDFQRLFSTMDLGIGSETPECICKVLDRSSIFVYLWCDWKFTWPYVASISGAGSAGGFSRFENDDILGLCASLYQLERGQATRDTRANDHIFAGWWEWSFSIGEEMRECACSALPVTEARTFAGKTPAGPIRAGARLGHDWNGMGWPRSAIVR